MLRRLLALMAAAGLGAVLFAAPASADPPVECAVVDPTTGVCLVTAGGGGNGNGGGGDHGGGNGNGGGGGGDDDGGVTNPVINVNGQDCIAAGLADPQPSQSDPVWEGHTDGAIYVCITNPQGMLGTTVRILYWAATAPVAPPPPDPEDLAREAIASMGLHAIDIGIVPEPTPGSIGVVGMPTWLWAANPGEATVGPITRTASAQGYTVTATARLDHIVWSMGDGTAVTCVGAGTPYDDAYGKSSSPTCGHTYTRQGNYTVNATSYWTVAWQGIGETGTIPLDFTNSTAITMGEAQVITQLERYSRGLSVELQVGDHVDHVW
ncbi:hypothetical protein Xcel_3428 (plasmid) [Xylanimonas cellulosilytica DSM 15894]|uniref:PKD domain-containing protein n=1 Tax=Xylanimonas cellulosilytica (strain DSM 15894 / JCM 12276 / CECT 5975 / KCTC 9989 / LMG 20990 / NBRC 107835 / XIL07) TaxID=446471 RepID=D1C0W1_XYLCX|nr:hypothetical protein [Xylanimonas cellulosilytica]ACZ32427.1 hypothetical protein Xcel_3428 [Xylanimonas cellulosilytica DSM 15894]